MSYIIMGISCVQKTCRFDVDWTLIVLHSAEGLLPQFIACLVCQALQIYMIVLSIIPCIYLQVEFLVKSLIPCIAIMLQRQFSYD